ncbi:MAG TPA: hypothetical protein VGD08_19655 [Stellaceae bacterium]
MDSSTTSRADLARAGKDADGGDRGGGMPSIGLSAVIVAATGDEPRVLTVRTGRDRLDALPSGPLEPEHRTLEVGLRAWVERQTNQALGYVEQLYTFGDRDRSETDGSGARRALSVAYLALVREARPAGAADAVWRSWYRFFPWEDWRDGRPAILADVDERLRAWAAAAPSRAERQRREERIGLTFGLAAGAGGIGGGGSGWNDERVLDRYELLYETRLAGEFWREIGETPPDGHVAAMDVPMALDHRRILATAIGRLRGKIKYRPVVFELMPPSFTLLQLQRTVEALSGMRLHKQNFRRLVEQQGLVEETGETTAETGGRPARLVRFRREVLLERPAPGVRVSAGRRAAAP